MGLAKTESFSGRHNQIARVAKALGHPARIAILEFLLKKKSCHCGGLVDELPLSQATVSQHLKELKKAGLIKGEIEGPRICYCINEPVWRECRHLIESLFGTPSGTGYCCF